MPQASGPIRYLDPTSELGQSVHPYTPRLAQLETPVIGLFHNTFIDAEAFLEDVAVAILEAVPGAEFRRFDKEHRKNMTFPAPQAQIEAMAAACDGVIVAYGHCGSCTSAVTRDAVALARAGIPVAALVTTKFEDSAYFVARAAGVPEVPFVILPHPIAGESAEYQRRVARAIAPRILQGFRTGRSSRAEDLRVDDEVFA